MATEPVVMNLAEMGEENWLLTTDGNLWLARESTDRGMTKVDGALGLWVTETGHAFVARRETSYRIDPL